MVDVTNDSSTTLALADSTGVESVEFVVADGSDVTITGATTALSSTFTGVAAADTIATVTLSGLSTATDGGADAYTTNLNNADLADLVLAGVEAVTINLSGKDVDVADLSADALESLTITGGVNDATVTTENAVIGSGIAVQFVGLDTGETAVINAAGSTGAVTVNTTDDNDLTVTGGAGLLTVNNTADGTGASNDDNISVTVTAGAGGVDATIQAGDNAATATAINTVTFTGSAAADTVDISLVVNPTNITATTADESKSVNATINTGAGNDTITIDAAVVAVDAGVGDDTIVIADASDLTADDSVDFGDGIDTLSISSLESADFDGLAAAVLAKVTGYEKVSISDAYGAAALDLTKTEANYLIATTGVSDGDGTANEDMAVTVADAATVEFTDSATATQDDVLAITVKDAAAAGATANSLNIVLNTDDLVTANITVKASVASVETVNITTATTDEDTTTKDYILDLSTSSGITTVNIDGGEDLQFKAEASTSTVNGEDATGALTITQEAGAGAMLIKGGSGADDITAIGADVIYGNGGNDTITSDATNAITAYGGDGIDTFELDDSSIAKDFTVGDGGDVLKTTDNTAFTAIVTESATDLTLKVVAEATTYTSSVTVADGNVIAISTDTIADFDSKAEIDALFGGAGTTAFTAVTAGDEFTLLVADTTTGKVHVYDLEEDGTNTSLADAADTLTEIAILEGVSAADLGDMIAGNFVA